MVLKNAITLTCVVLSCMLSKQGSEVSSFKNEPIIDGMNE